MSEQLAIVLMTALVPTTGHEDLIRFASNYVGPGGRVYVFVSSRSFEPVDWYERTNVLLDFIDREKLWGVSIVSHEDDEAPQNPKDENDKEFWDYWKQTILDEIDVHKGDVIIASETYGQTLANHMGLQFVPYDVARQMNGTKGTAVRHNIRARWSQLSRGFQLRHQQRFVMFGQESVGKTTIAKRVASQSILTKWVPEYARGYLETVGAELTQEKMATIARGQNAIERAFADKSDYHSIFFDTDLLSTIGYYRINGYDKKYPVDYDTLLGMYYPKDKIYFLLPDDVPFEADSLRYGGDKRESTYQFWKDLLNEFGCRYYEIKPNNLLDKMYQIGSLVDQVFHQEFDAISDFERE